MRPPAPSLRPRGRIACLLHVVLAAAALAAAEAAPQDLSAVYEVKHIALAVPEGESSLLQRVTAVVLRAELDGDLFLGHTAVLTAANRSARAFEVLSGFHCADGTSFPLRTTVRPADKDWVFVALPAFQPELRLVWEASEMARAPVTGPTLWAALVHPTDPLAGRTLPPLEQCRVLVDGNATLDGDPIAGGEMRLRPFVPHPSQYAAPKPEDALSVHRAAALFVSSSAWHATVLAASANARHREPFTALEHADQRLSEEPAPTRRQAAARRLLGRRQGGKEADGDVELVTSDEPLDAAVFGEDVASSPKLRAAPEVFGLDGEAARQRVREQHGLGEGQEDWEARDPTTGGFVDPTRTPGLFDRVPSAYETRSAEDVAAQHVFLQTGEAARALDTMLVGVRDANEAQALPELKASGLPQDRPTRAAVRAARGTRERDIALVLLEANEKVTTLMQVGVKSREVFAMIVDSIMNHLPEILCNVITGIAAAPVINQVGKMLSCVLPPILVPSTGAEPCIAPGPDLPSGKPMPVAKVEAPPCVCDGPSTPLYDFIQLSEAGFLPRQGDTACPCSNSDTATAGGNHALLESGGRARSTGHETGGGKQMSTAAILHTMQAKATDKGGPIGHTLPKVKKDVNDGVMEAALPAVLHNAASVLSDTLPQRVRTQAHRATSRALMHSLTKSVTAATVQSLSHILSRELTFVTTRSLVRALVPTLTHSLAPSITLALTHSPKSDYYCAHCEKHKMYCHNCEMAKQSDYMAEYYSNYYASYYSSYYTENYVAIGDLISATALGH